MGLSIVVSGAVMSIALLSVLFALPNIVDSIVEVRDVSSQSMDLEEKISHTSPRIKSLTAASTNSYIDLVLTNNGTEKLWNYNDFTVIVTYDADLGGASASKVTETFVFNSTNSFSGGTTEFLVPNAEDNDGWSSTTGSNPCNNSNPWNCIDETTQDNTDLISTANLNNADFEKVNFGLTDPTVSSISEVTVYYAYSERDGPGDNADPVLVVELREGANIIATWTEGSGTLPADPTFDVATEVLNAAEIASITDFSALSLNFTADCGAASCSGGGNNDQVRVSWAIVKVVGPVNADPGEWSISEISGDVMDPQILNNEEAGTIRIMLSNPIFANGEVIVSISTDNGVTATSTTTAT